MRSYSCSICHESQLGTCTPLVMWPIGTSSSIRHGQRLAHILRLTCPCNALTALARRDIFSPSTVMQNGSLLL